MALVQIAFTSASGLPIVQAIPEPATQFINSTATSTATTGASGNGGVCTVTVTGNDVWVAFGASPVAAPNTHWLVLAGQTRDFAVTPGMRAAVIDRA
jgi:hypothetical protein